MKNDLPLQWEEEISETMEEILSKGEDLYERKEEREETLPLILFRVFKEWYGIDLSNVRGILKRPKITFVPSLPEWILGIINLRGRILPILDLKPILGLHEEGDSQNSRIIAVEVEGQEIGLLVDEVVETIEFPIKKIEPLCQSFPSEGKEYLKGLLRWEKKIVGLFNIERILEKGRP